MDTKEFNGHQVGLEMCVICGSPVEHENGSIRTNHRGNTINLCSSQCLKTFADEPDVYLARLAKNVRKRAFTTALTEEVNS